MLISLYIQTFSTVKPNKPNRLKLYFSFFRQTPQTHQTYQKPPNFQRKIKTNGINAPCHKLSIYGKS